MKTFISVVFAASTLFFVSTQAQIIEETVIEDEAIVTQNKPDSTEKYSHRFKDPSDCEDACEEDCDKTCESLCGKNETCIDSCEDTCEDNCDIECSKLKLAYGPQKGSVLLFISGNSLIFHNSSISQEEDKYLEQTDMHMIYVDKNNNPVDTVRLKYSYISISGAFGIQYYLTEKLGLGVQYEFMQTNQNIDNAYEYSSGALLNTNTISGIVTAHLIQKKRIGLSVGGNFGVIWGQLHRFPLMYEDVVGQTNMSFEQESFIRAMNEKVDLNGIGFTLNVNAQYMINKLLTISGGPRYIYRYLFLSNDKISGYPGVSHSNDIGIVVNFGIVINGKNAH